MDHGGEGCDGKNVAGDFDGAFFGGALDFLETLGMRHRANVPDVVENFSGVANQERGKFAIVVPGAGDGAFINFLAFFIEEERNGRNVGVGAIEADITLALLLGIVERMGVKEGPNELSANVFEAEFEMSVLVDGVVTAVEGGGADIKTLLVGDFFGANEARGITGAGGGDGGIKGVRESVAKCDAGRGGFDEFAGARAIEHAGLTSHDGSSLYTGGEWREVESREEKLERKEDNTETRREVPESVVENAAKI